MKRVWDNSMWLKFALLLTSVVSVIWVDSHAGYNRSQKAIVENKRDLQMLWDTISKLVESEGVGSLPIQEQEAWESLDVYLVDAIKGEFENPPRFEPWHSRVAAFLQGESKTPVTCWTRQFKLAVGGESGVGLFQDYRDLNVISAYGLVTIEGDDFVLLVEMDVAEALAVSPPNYWDEIIVTVCCLLVAVVVFFVHRHRDQMVAENNKIITAAQEAIEINEKLQRELNERRTKEA